MILAPRPITQCRPTMHFLMLARSPTLEPSPIRVSGEIWADVEIGGGAASSAGTTEGATSVIAREAILRSARRLSSQYPANEFARTRYSGSGAATILLRSPLLADFFEVVSGVSTSGGLETMTWHFHLCALVGRLKMPLESNLGVPGDGVLNAAVPSPRTCDVGVEASDATVCVMVD